MPDYGCEKIVQSMIYLDNNATTQMDHAVLEGMLPYFTDKYGNPSSPYSFGQQANEAVVIAREHVAKLIGAEPEQIIFVSCATEANNAILYGIAQAYKAPTVLSSSIEHSSVKGPIKYLVGHGRMKCHWIQPDAFGQVTPELFKGAITSRIAFATVMAANNVVHTTNPIADLVSIAHQHGIVFHTDATQWVGKLPFSVKDTRVDAISFSAHKLYGPKGIGALFVNNSLRANDMLPLLHGGHQEFGMRGGTLNVPAIVGFGIACDLACRRMSEDSARVRSLASQFLDKMRVLLPDIQLNGHPSERLPGGVSLTIPGADVKAMLRLIPEIAIGTGSACDQIVGQGDLFHELENPGAAHSTLRIQIGRFNNSQEMQRAAEEIAKAVEIIRCMI